MQHFDDLLAPHGNLLDPEHYYGATDGRPGARCEEETMIARVWKGAVRKRDGDAYARYMQGTGVAGYARSPGNRGVWMLRRNVDDRPSL